MNNQHSTLSVMARRTFKSILIALLISVAVAAQAQGNLLKIKSVPQNEIALHNYAATTDDPGTAFESARVVHNVKVNGEVGMRVHTKFTVTDGLGVPCMLIAYFFYDDGTPLKTTDPKYRTKTGTVYAHVNFTPAYDPAVYKDLQLFVPYDALNMESGAKHDLKFYLALYDKEGERFFGKSGWYEFQLTIP